MLTSPALVAQNLVPNPSFEDYSSCPTFASQLDRAIPWFNPNIGTPEYYNACADWGSYMSVPASQTGSFQYPRTGNGFAGIYVFRTDVPNMREYVEVQLTSPLEQGKCYLVEFHVNAPNDHPYACDGVGAKLNVGPLTANDAQPFSVTPEVTNPAGELIADTLGWKRIFGYYTAQGGEDHITIGNFNNDVNTSWTTIQQGVWYQTSAYLYVDDVKVEERVLEVDLGVDQDLCEEETIELDASANATYYQWNDGSTDSVRTVGNAGFYIATAHLGGCFASDTVEVSVTKNTRVLILGPERICDDQTITLTAAADYADQIQWNTGSGSLQLEVTEPGVYSVSAQNRCSQASDSHLVEEKDCFCEVFVPNSFTPNRDLVNDRFGPISGCSFSEYRFTIHNRWGEMIFDTSDPSDTWNGDHKGLGVESGIFAWTLAYVTKDFQRSDSRTGVVVLNR